MLMLTLGGDQAPWGSPLVVGLGVAALALARRASCWHVRRAPEPLIPLGIFANRVVDKAAGAMFFGMLVYIAATVYLPLYFELCLGLDPTSSGLGLIVVLGASVVGSNITGLNLPRVKHYKVMGMIGLPVASGGAGAVLALFAPVLGLWGALFVVLIYGLGLGALFPTLTVSVQNAVDPARHGRGDGDAGFCAQPRLGAGRRGLRRGHLRLRPRRTGRGRQDRSGVGDDGVPRGVRR